MAWECGRSARESSYEHGAATKEAFKTSTSAGIKASGVGIEYLEDGTAEERASTRNTATEHYRRSKIEYLRRQMIDFRDVFGQLANLSDGDSYLILDDLYHLRRAEQPLVVDYLHSIAKGNRLWLKIGTIRHRSSWYIHGPPPQGMKLGDDANDIDLDLTLEKYSLAKTFLRKILQNFAKSVDLADGIDFLTDTGLDRLVLASGGVARDFLAIFGRAVLIARERGADSSRGDRIGAEDVNAAAGHYEPTKREEFNRDIYADEKPPLDEVFQEVRKFCLEKANSNYFLIDKELHGNTVDGIHELVDLKLLHLIRSRVTVNTRQGRIYEAYMLDLSQYAGARKKRDLDLVEFWRSESTDQLRKAGLIFAERPK